MPHPRRKLALLPFCARAASGSKTPPLPTPSGGDPEGSERNPEALRAQPPAVSCELPVSTFQRQGGRTELSREVGAPPADCTPRSEPASEVVATKGAPSPL